MTRRILIPGGLGYLGGRLAQFLASQEDYEILLGSRRQTRPPSWLPQSKVVETQWDSPQGLQEVCSGVDCIVHLAGMNAQDCAADPAAAMRVNAVATAHLVQAAIRQKVKRFIYMSTVHVYGSPLTGVITEEIKPTPVHPYALSHQIGEDAVLASHQSGEIEGVVIRLSNTYGAPVDKDVNCWMLLVNDLCKQAAISGRLVLRSAGLQKRDFIPLHDVTRAIGHFIECHFDKSRDGIFNLGGEATYRIIDLAELISERCEAVLGYRPEIERPDPVPGESYPKLNYRIDKLKETGFSLNGNVNKKEIDATLEFCHKKFRKIT
jgi:UDP-glucose 4-epimerase